MTKTTNPAARAGAIRVLKVKAFSSSIDNQNPTEMSPELQPSRAVLALMHRASISIHHARVVCEQQGLGGAA
ncbi:UNVERIFIED_ORG: hypothetical protein GGE64_003972 [Rhizobium etli]|uniref:hypothetical protein n=1 Tax=Rhizobium phaseoli TaxID=396 RepID=UPI000F87F5A8|nr:hypothetical protein [Rhizobium phaseoli]RUM21536.1 hypothetical protein EFD56_03370 [Rhizobium phaseoli]